jgi:hypothetical protein
MLSVDGFNEVDWRSQCDLLAEQSSKGCGLSHTVFVDKFSSAVDSALFHLSSDKRIPLLEIAREWDYATPQERHDEQIDCAQNGYCSHGIKFGCCPAGCEESPSLADEYLQEIHDLKDKLGIAEETSNDLIEQLDDLRESVTSSAIESLEIEIYALEHERDEVQRERDEADYDAGVWKHLYYLVIADQEYRKKHPIRSLFGMTPSHQHMNMLARQLYETEEDS